MSPMVKLPLTLEHALLGFLREAPMHAYEMHQHLEQAEALGLIWHIKQSQLYALLTRLEEAGYIEVSIHPQGNRPPRKLLHLTPDGRAAFLYWLTAPVTHGRDFRQEFLAKLFFAQQDGPVTVTRLVDAQRALCQRLLADLHGQIEAFDTHKTYDWLVLQFRVTNLEAILSWLDVCTATLVAPRAP